jgi:L-ribulose-5-phosphate 3-epimerase UlaE
MGVMQGRLLPKYQGHYQAHPVGYWHQEFPLAANLGLDCIEFILDYNNFKINPLMTTHGRQQIQFVSNQTGVRVLSICADYFMKSLLHSNDEQTTVQSTEVLVELLKIASELKIKDVVIPCVDQSSIQANNLRVRFTEVLLSIIPEAERYEVNLSLETDLDPSQFEKLLAVFNSSRVTVNYDIGNSAALGYNYKDELNAYGERISDIHIKDRELGRGSVTLGSGNADIPGFFEYLSHFNYQGPFIMQAYRDDEGISVFKDQLDWLKQNVLSLWSAA